MKQIIIQALITILVAIMACGCEAREPQNPGPPQPVFKPKKTIVIRRPQKGKPITTPRPLSVGTYEGPSEELSEELSEVPSEVPSEGLSEEIVLSEEEFEQFLESNNDYFYVVE